MITFVEKYGYRVTATAIPHEKHQDELIKQFPGIHLVVEATIVDCIKKLSPLCEYNKNEHWELVELSNGGFYFKLKSKEPVELLNPDNYFSATVSADAASIIVSICAYAHLYREFKQSYLGQLYVRLLEFSRLHIEGTKILEAID